MATYQSAEAQNQAARDKTWKLPIWAQDYIHGLERRAEQAEKELAEIKQGPAGSNVFRVWGARSDDQAIGKGAHIRFNFGPEWDNIDVRHDRRLPGALHVSGDRPISIEPQAGNTIVVKLVDR